MSTSLPRRSLLLACGGSFLAFLDVTVTNLAVPALASDFGGVSIRSLSWVVTLYAIVFAALLAPAGGWLTCSGIAGCTPLASSHSPGRHCWQQ